MVRIECCFAEHLTWLRRHRSLGRSRGLGGGSGFSSLSFAVSSGRVEALIESLQGDSSSSFCFSTSAAWSATRQSNIAAVRRTVGQGERSAYTKRYENIKDLLRHRRHSWLDRRGEEFGKGKRLAGVPSKRCRLTGLNVGENSLVKSEICPAREEAEKC